MGHAHCRTGYRSALLPPFNGHSHAGGSRAGSGNGTRNELSPEEGGHRGGPSLRDKESGFYSRTSLFLGKGLHPFLDLS